MVSQGRTPLPEQGKISDELTKTPTPCLPELLVERTERLGEENVFFKVYLIFIILL